MTAPNDGELKQLVVDLVGQIYYAVRDGMDPDGPEVTAGVTSLLQALTPTGPVERSVDVPQTPEELEAVLNERSLQTARRAYGALVYMVSLFNELARYAEHTSPDIDVPEFLRRAGLRAGSDK